MSRRVWPLLGFYAPRLRAAEAADDGDEMLSVRPPVPARIGTTSRRAYRVRVSSSSTSTGPPSKCPCTASQPIAASCSRGACRSAPCAAYPQADAVCEFDDQSHQHRVGRLDSDAADEGFVDLPQSSGRPATRRAMTTRHRNRPPPTGLPPPARRSAPRRAHGDRCSCSARRLPWTIDPAADRSRGECPQRG